METQTIKFLDIKEIAKMAMFNKLSKGGHKLQNTGFYQKGILKLNEVYPITNNLDIIFKTI